MNRALLLAAVAVYVGLVAACATQSGDMSPGTASIFVHEIRHIGATP